jgi:hypothetical protein
MGLVKMAKKKRERKKQEYDLAQQSVMMLTKIMNELVTCNAQDIYQTVDLLRGANAGIEKYAKFFRQTLIDSGEPIANIKGFSFTSIAYRFLIREKLELDDVFYSNFIQLPLLEHQGVGIRDQHIMWDSLSARLDAAKETDRQVWEVLRIELDLMTPKGPLIEVVGGTLV